MSACSDSDVAQQVGVQGSAVRDAGDRGVESFRRDEQPRRDGEAERARRGEQAAVDGVHWPASVAGIRRSLSGLRVT